MHVTLLDIGVLVQQVGQTYFQNNASGLTLTSWTDSGIHKLILYC